MFKASVFLNSNALRILYCSLFLPYINYCCEIWGVTYKNTTNPIVIQQKRAIRIVSKVGKREHTSKLFCQLNILKFTDLVDIKVAVIMYKAHKGLLPIHIQNNFSRNTGSDYCLRNKSQFKVRHARKKMKSNSITIYGFKVFNNLSKITREAGNVFAFKRLYKKALFSQYVVIHIFISWLTNLKKQKVWLFLFLYNL